MIPDSHFKEKTFATQSGTNNQLKIMFSEIS
jgi:hypothetical protein